MTTETPATDYTLTCRHCGQRFLETAKLLFHPCPAQQPSRPAKQPKARKNRVEASHA